MSSERRPVLVTGGTGTLGSAVVRRLLEREEPVRVLSRRDHPEDGSGREWARGDLTTGSGIDAATAGVGAVVHCATMLGRKDVRATKLLAESLLDQAGNTRPHLVYISIVGVDRVPYFYYRAKLAAERVVEDSGLPWTILRATQFHDLVSMVTTVQRRLPVTFAPAVRCQPVDTGEVAERLVETALGEPAGRVPDMGGPEVLSGRDLAKQTLRAHGLRRPVVPVRLPGKVFRAYREGGHLAPERRVGRIAYDEYLRTAELRGARRGT